MFNLLKFIFSKMIFGGVAPVRFDGKDLYIPGYYAKRDISKVEGGGASGSTVIIIGKSTEGIPFNATSVYPNVDERVNWITNTKEAREMLVSGEGYDAVRMALNPSNQPGINGAPLVGFIRMDLATQGSIELGNSDTPEVATLKLTSKVFGTNANQIQVKIATGTTEGKKISIKYKDNPINEQDNINYAPITISYSGAGSAVALAIDPTTALTTTVTGASGENLNILFSSFNTVQSLIDAINNHSSGVYLATANDPSLLSLECSKLDEVTSGDSVNLKSATYTILAQVQACIDFFNSSNYLYSDGFVSTAKRRKLKNIAYTFLSGAVNGSTPSVANWQTAIDMCEQIDASFIQVVTSDSSIHAYLSTHISFMNGDGKNERQGMVGSTSVNTDAEKKSSAQALNSLYMGFYGDEVKLYDENGVETVYPGYIAGALVVGMSAGNAITLPPTNKQLNIIGKKQNYSKSQLDNFIKSGVIVSNPSPLGGIRVVRSVTTYQGANIIANEWSAVRTILFITKDHRAYVQSKVGDAGDNTTLSSIESRAKERLEYYQENNFFVVDPDKGNAFRNVVVTAVGDTFNISYEATLVLPVNFILVTHNFTIIGAK